MLSTQLLVLITTFTQLLLQRCLAISAYSLASGRELKSWEKEAESCNLSTDNCKFPIQQIMGAQNFNSAL